MSGYIRLFWHLLSEFLNPLQSLFHFAQKEWSWTSLILFLPCPPNVCWEGCCGESTSFPAVSALALTISLRLLQLTPGGAPCSWQYLEQRFPSHFDPWTDSCGPSLVVQYTADVRPRVASVHSFLLFTSQRGHKGSGGETALLKISFLQGWVSAITSVVLCNL